MAKTILFFAFLGVSSITLGQKSTSYDSRDLASLKSLPVRWERYWNTHDMDSMGTLLKDNVDFINVAGVWLKGKKQAVSDHQQKHLSFRFRSSTWKTDSADIQYIRADVALMHIKWEISGDYETENQPRPPRSGIFTWVVEKEKGKWLVRAVQNTNVK